MTNTAEDKTDPDLLDGIRAHQKCMHEYFRHLSSISTVAIFLIAAFVDKVFPESKSTHLVGFTICCFLVTVISSVVGYTVFLISYPIDKVKNQGPIVGRIYASSLILSWFSFIVGMATMTYFLLLNIGD